ncbi:MAG: hypothetical protein H0V17_14505 [Deltaproteobacteria bacterium]|nr:hypothetical protein [Deltaproteobacteria bacterium]
MKTRGEDDKELLRDVSTATIEQALASPSVRLKIAAIEAIATLELPRVLVGGRGARTLVVDASATLR